jgi:CPA2 family monovalent cation:H+ antiporter-2
MSIPHVIVEAERETAEALRAKGVPIIYGDGARSRVLLEAHIVDARLLVVAVPDPYQARAIIEQARSINPTIETVARTHSESERSYLERHGVGLALIGEHELAFGLAHYTLMRMGSDDDQADAAIDAMRRRPPHARRARGPSEAASGNR